MSQDAEQPKSRRDLRHAQMPVSSSTEEAPEREYPSVPLLPPSGLAPAAPSPAPASPAAGQRDHGAHAAAAARTRQARRAEERARLAAEAAGILEPGVDTSRTAEPVTSAEAINRTVINPPVSHPPISPPPMAKAPLGQERSVPQPDAQQADRLQPDVPQPVAGEIVRSRRALDSVPDVVVEPKTERNSQVRARNRAALRAYREVVEPERAEAPLPSRRLLRQQQVEAEQAPATNPQGFTAVQATPAAPTETEPPTTLPGHAGRKTTGAEASAVAEPLPERHSEPGLAPTAAALSLPEALAERDALIDSIRDFNASLPANEDPLAVDLELLAQQKALAERAAILNERALARARLAEESADARQRLNDPTAAHNLAMVTPLQFVKVPGVEDPVLKPPATSHIPVVSRSSPIAPPSMPPATPPRSMPTVPAVPVAAEALDATAAPAARHGRTQVLRRAEEAAQVRLRPRNLFGASSVDAAEAEAAANPDAQPLPAQAAHGLEPLDAVTAGLGRVKRNRLLSWGAAVVGFAALISIFITMLAR